MSTFRDVLVAVTDDLQAYVGGLGPERLEGRLYYSSQFIYPDDGPSLACWFEMEEQEDEGPTGSRLYRELYVFRYWEPAAVDEETMVVDDDAGLVLENLYEETRTRLLQVGAQSFGSSTPLWILRGKHHMADEIPEDGSQAAFTRGWELHLWSRRFRAFE